MVTPEVNIEIRRDALGQQYKTLAYVVGERGSDVITVGRGIYGSNDMIATAEDHRPIQMNLMPNKSKVRRLI